MSSSRRSGGGRPAHEAASPSALAPAILRWAKARQIDVAVLADRAGLDLDGSVPDVDELPITSTALARLFDLTAEISAEPHLGIRLPSELVFRRYDAGALAARVAATPRDVLLAIARYSALVFPRLEAKVVEDAPPPVDVVRLDLTIAGAPRGLGHHVDSYLLAFVLGHCRRGGTIVVPRSVRLLSARPSADLGPLVHAFGTEDIEFGCESTGLTLDAGETASRGLPSFDPMLVAAAEQIASAALKTAPRSNVKFATTVEARIETMLASSSPTTTTTTTTTGANIISAETVAAAMKMSGRTMQRRLEDEGGARFSVLFDQVRERLAKELLQNEAMPLTEIAYRVGFSDIATFSRAFKRWTGMPPGAYRRTTTTTTTTTKRAF